MSSSQELPVGMVVRTLMAAGYRIQDATRQPSHLEICASAFDELGIEISYLFAFAGGVFSPDTLRELQSVALTERKQLVLIAPFASKGVMSLDDMVGRLGGAIPTWRALSDDYLSKLHVLGLNRLPDGSDGEAWQLFEDAVGDGLEFLFGLRVKRLGSKNRGARVPDSICLTSDGAVLLVDAKASQGGFDATADNLRALKEYAEQQITVQTGVRALSGCVIVSSIFKQPANRLAVIGGEFLSDTGVPLAFLGTSVMEEMVLAMRSHIRIRNAVRWKRVFCVSGAVDPSKLQAEISSITQLRMP